MADLCSIEIGRTPARDNIKFWDPARETGNVWISIADMNEGVAPRLNASKEHLSDAGAAITPIVPEGALLLSFKLSLGKLAFAGRALRTNEAIAALIPNDERVLDRNFLYWYLRSFDWADAAKGSEKIKGSALNKAKLKEIPIPLPPLEQQKRIADSLAAAFEEIVRIRKNAERCLERVEELEAAFFLSQVAKATDGAIQCALGDQITLQRGVDITKNEQRNGPVPVVSSGGIKSFHDTAVAKGPGVVIGRKGSIGTAYFLEDAYWPHDTTLWVKDFKGNSAKFVFFLLRSLNLKRLDSGAANPALNRNNVHPIRVSWPTAESQNKIVNAVHDAMALSKRLEDTYQSKLRLLAELSSAVLHRAFSDQLASEQTGASATIEATATRAPEFTADILAFTYSRHVTARRDRTVGRVKGQKVLHLVESVAKVDLGRQPMKDAAGPNDSAHMRKAEQWAAEQDYFTFVQRSGGGYDFKKGKAFDRLLAGAYARLAPHRDAISRVIDLVVPMDSEEAEVLATVHAAWNNLLIDGIEPTRQAILQEARQNWAPSKLEIAEAKFENAIRFIRQNGLVPDGSSKAVRHMQERLFD